jgi:hypothetical protein
MVLPGRIQGDVVTNILLALKLDPPLPRKVVDQIQDALQLLRTKKSIGSLGVKHDSERKRACALLEYFAREQCGIKIPMEDLVKQAHAKKKGEFVKFHQVVGNMRDHWTASSAKKGSAVGSVVGVKPTNVGTVQNQNSSGLNKGSFNVLAVQLGAFVPHSNVVARQALVLFQEILKVIQTKHYGERKYALQDVQKNQQAYEAACFYLVATQDSSKSNRNANKQHPLPSAKLDKDQKLDLSTFLNATKDFSQSEFETVLNYVRDLQEQVGAGQDAIPSSRKRARATTSNTEKHSEARTAVEESSELPSRKRRQHTMNDDDGTSQEPSIATAKALLEMGERRQQFEASSFNEEMDTYQTPAPTSILYSPVFLQWKHKVLQAALATAKEEVEAKASDNEGKENEGDEAKTAYEEAALLNVAVNNILKTRGIASPSAEA